MTHKQQKIVSSSQSSSGKNDSKTRANSISDSAQTRSNFDEFRAKYADILKKAGLTGKEAVVFDLLLEKGESGAKEIITGTNLKRGDAYNHIYSLIKKGLVSEHAIRGRKKFSVEHPSLIGEYVEMRAKRLTEATKELQAVLPGLISTYNLSYHKPGVKVFEGMEGIKKVMDDSLASQTPILTFLDPIAVDKYMRQANKQYVSNRKKRKIVKKILVEDNEYNRKHYAGSGDELTMIKYLLGSFPAHYTVMQIYNDKISYMTIKPNSAIGVIIDDKNITTMHRALFEMNWSQANQG